MIFPLSAVPKESWKESPRRFGANRDGGRKHAGCDLYAPVATPIRAVADGTIVTFKEFYLGTYYITVDHNDFTVRYGEVLPEMAEGLKVGSKVKEGDVIGYVGHLKGLKASMLHFEMYSGKASGPLTVKGNTPFQRRSDLVDPTSFLDDCALKVMAQT